MGSRNAAGPGQIGIVIVGHGQLGQEFRAAVEHVMGPVQGMVAISIAAECDRCAKADEIRAAADAVDTGAGVAVVVDLHGSSPANLCRDMRDSNAARHILTGANVPMLLKLTQSRHLPLTEAVHAALSAGRKYIDAHSITPEEHS